MNNKENVLLRILYVFASANIRFVPKESRDFNKSFFVEVELNYKNIIDVSDEH